MLLQLIFGFYSWFFLFIFFPSVIFNYFTICPTQLGWMRVCSFAGVCVCLCGGVCVFGDFFFVCSLCSNVAKYSDKSHSQIQFLNDARGENNTYTRLSLVMSKKLVYLFGCVGDCTLQCDVPTKQTDVFIISFNCSSSLK